MLRLSFVVMAALLSLSVAQAQEPEHTRRDPYITSTGETVDKPGVPQASAPTKLDRKIQRQDNAIDSGICKGC